MYLQTGTPATEEVDGFEEGSALCCCPAAIGGLIGGRSSFIERGLSWLDRDFFTFF